MIDKPSQTILMFRKLLYNVYHFVFLSMINDASFLSLPVVGSTLATPHVSVCSYIPSIKQHQWMRCHGQNSVYFCHPLINKDECVSFFSESHWWWYHNHSPYIIIYHIMLVFLEYPMILIWLLRSPCLMINFHDHPIYVWPWHVCSHMSGTPKSLARSPGSVQSRGSWLAEF